MSRRLFLHAAAVAAGSILLPACGGGGGDSGAPIGTDTLAQLLRNDSRLSLMRAAADKGGMIEMLGDASQNLTLFAAENDAFDTVAQRIGLGDGNGMLNAFSASDWQSILRYALLPQRRSQSSLTDSRFDTLYEYRGDQMQLIFVTVNGRFTIWAGAGSNTNTMLRANLGASNGVMHVTADLVLPRGVLTMLQMLRASIADFSDFARSIGVSDATGLLDGAAPYTVFAPINGTGAAGLTSAQVRRHILSGELDSVAFVDGQILAPLSGSSLTLRRSLVNGREQVTLNSGSTLRANVTDVDFWARNGVIHVIDAVIL